MFKSIGELEKVILVPAAASSTLLVELVVAVAAAAGAAAVVVEEEAVEAAQAPQRHHQMPQMCHLQSMRMARKSRLDGGNTIGRPHNSLPLTDTILANTGTLRLTLHGHILKI
jgi:hypothetical protein